MLAAAAVFSATGVVSTVGFSSAELPTIWNARGKTDYGN